MRIAIAAVLMLALSSCGERGSSQPPPAAQAPAPTEAAPAAAASTPAPASNPIATGAMPAPGAIGYAGFGPAPFGADEEQVRMAWGKALDGPKPDTPAGCYYLLPQPRSQHGYRIGFMFEDARFVRIDVDAPDIEAPGGGRVGMTTQDIQRLYAGHVQVQNHKYVEGGHYLRVPNPGGGSGVVLFETDATGRVTAWRIGEPPQVDYVEGCS
ncbi:hypothetical protein [Lysobacter arvi]|uniref:Lectin n=1 Tax=Lysobacter arvi TaxID=3038776 RepID=A0ABU1CFE7_9GAMM|nr:hypothetical protein [Lysobacter arvi]MDR0183680.1 hypothetical protein [Lysobacter arvi]